MYFYHIYIYVLLTFTFTFNTSHLLRVGLISDTFKLLLRHYLHGRLSLLPKSYYYLCFYSSMDFGYFFKTPLITKTSCYIMFNVK